MTTHTDHLTYLTTHRPIRPCTAHDLNFGGSCFNCGYQPKPETTTGHYWDLCQACCWALHPLMMTTYGLDHSACDRCGYVGELAICQRTQRTKQEAS